MESKIEALATASRKCDNHSTNQNKSSSQTARKALMENTTARFESIDAYIASFPAEIQTILQDIRKIIQAAAPDAEEKISYQMPTFFLKGNLVHFAAFKHHIGFYPTPSGTEAFKEEIVHYQRAKGSIQFPLDEPMPLDLITRIVKMRVAENLKKAESKARKRN
jgi:uncharacterized protein YdhG (YjbR/CyaY superfamily)